MKISARPCVGAGRRAATTATLSAFSIWCHEVALLNIDSRVTVRVPTTLVYKAYGRRPIRLGIAYPEPACVSETRGSSTHGHSRVRSPTWLRSPTWPTRVAITALAGTLDARTRIGTALLSDRLPWFAGLF